VLAGYPGLADLSTLRIGSSTTMAAAAPKEAITAANAAADNTQQEPPKKSLLEKARAVASNDTFFAYMVAMSAVTTLASMTMKVTSFCIYL
jgi:hypothetical protein